MGIYIHIPFCIRKCKYCDFLSFPADEAVRSNYVSALVKEVRQWESPGSRFGPGPSRPETGAVLERPGGSDHDVVSIFFGGGTPSIPAAEQISEILDAVRERFSVSPDAEITIECNPGTVDFYKLRQYRTMGINRLSIGLQSAHDRELSLLGRIHDRAAFEETFHAARQAGFANINVDLISGLPGQKLDDWRATLAYVMDLPEAPEHVSAYSLIVEEGTPFYEMYHQAETARAKGKDPGDQLTHMLALPSEETEREMYRKTDEILKSHGYERYEISNYAKPGFESKHNLGYWERRPYIGFGLGAASFLNHMRWSNTRDLGKYLDAFGQGQGELAGKSFCEAAGADIREDVHLLTKAEEMEETFFLGLRMTRGIDRETFVRKYGLQVWEEMSPRIEELVREGLLEPDERRIRLTGRGMDLEGYVEGRLLT